MVFVQRGPRGREVLSLLTDLGTLSSCRFRFHSAKCCTSTQKYITAVSNLFPHSLVFTFLFLFYEIMSGNVRLAIL